MSIDAAFISFVGEFGRSQRLYFALVRGYAVCSALSHPHPVAALLLGCSWPHGPATPAVVAPWGLGGGGRPSRMGLVA